jgi:hypothetical protein
VPLKLKSSEDDANEQANTQSETKSSNHEIVQNPLSANRHERPSLSSLLRPTAPTAENDAPSSSGPSSSSIHSPVQTQNKIEQSTPDVMHISQETMPQSLLFDLRSVFPELNIQDNVIWLTTDLNWRWHDIADISISEKGCVSNRYDKLTTSQRREIWIWMQQHVDGE